MATMQAKGIEKSFGDRQILRGCDLSVEPGECVGLVGINGAGKSTLLRIISGELEPDFGTVIGPGGDGAPGAGLGYLSQDPDLPGQNVGEALDAAIDWHRDLLNRYEQAMSDGRDRIAADLQEEIEQHGWQMDHQVAAMAERLGVAPRERAISALSGGERRRLALARVLLAAPKLLILDEPTNHLDAETIEWLQDWLERFRGAVLLVTHDRYLLEATANRIVEVDDGITVSYPGSYGDYLLARAERQALLERTEDRRLAMLAKEAAWAARSPAARSTKQKARLDRLEALQSVRPIRREEQFSLSFGLGIRKGGALLEVRGLRKGFGGPPLIQGLELILQPGDRLGILGPNGAGKSTLLHLVGGGIEADGGQFNRAPRLQIAMLDQNRTGLNPDHQVAEAAGGGGTHVQVGEHFVHVASFLDRLQFARQTQEQRVSTLSGGERARLLLAKVLLQGASMLLLDEPTNDLDLLTLRVLEEALLDYEGAVMVVSHDRAFLDRVCTAVLVFEEDGQITRYASREQARRARAERSRAQSAAAPKTKNKSKPRSTKRGRSFKEEREFEALPERLEALEAELEAVGAALSDPAVYRDDPERVATLTARSEALPEEIDALYARWEALEAMGAR